LAALKDIGVASGATEIVTYLFSLNIIIEKKRKKRENPEAFPLF